MREIRLLLKRVLKRVDLTSRSLITLIEPGSCFAGTLAELVFAADRAVMFAGTRGGDNRGPATLHLSRAEFRRLPDGQRADPAANPLPRRARQRRRRARDAIGADARRRRRRRARPGHRRLRRDRLGRRGAPDAGGARQFLARRADRPGGQSALRRPRNDGDAHLRPPDRLAELDLPAPERGRRGRRAETLRHRRAAGLRPANGSEQRRHRHARRHRRSTTTG